MTYLIHQKYKLSTTPIPKHAAIALVGHELRLVLIAVSQLITVAAAMPSRAPLAAAARAPAAAIAGLPAAAATATGTGVQFRLQFQPLSTTIPPVLQVLSDISDFIQRPFLRWSPACLPHLGARGARAGAEAAMGSPAAARCRSCLPAQYSVQRWFGSRASTASCICSQPAGSDIKSIHSVLQKAGG